jgi:hypothetical protein
MKTFIILLFFISIIFFIFAYTKDVKTNEINKQIEEENKKLLKDKENIEEYIKNLENKQKEEKEKLRDIKEITKDMNAAARAAFTEYSDALEQQYLDSEKEYDEDVKNLEESYDIIQDELLAAVAKAQKDLDKITSTRAAAMEAILKEQSIKEQLSFYCPQVPETELKDARTLRDIEYKLNNPRVLRMLI